MFDIKLTTTNRQTCCAPTSLKMLLDFYGHDVPLDTLIDECGVSVNGCSANDVLRVGRAHGLENLKAYRMDADAVFRNDRPAIIWWRGNHFNVYGGLNDKGEPVLFNPCRGVYPIDRGSFIALYSGVALCNGTPSDILPEDYFGEHEPEPDYFND
jgi:ABC-type bacteriocin/lantibiotic exporter with double-glycine peptidase domain